MINVYVNKLIVAKKSKFNAFLLVQMSPNVLQMRCYLKAKN